MYICTYVYIYTTGVHLVLAAVFSLVVKKVKFGSKYRYELSARQAEGVRFVCPELCFLLSAAGKKTKQDPSGSVTGEGNGGRILLYKYMGSTGGRAVLFEKEKQSSTPQAFPPCSSAFTLERCVAAARSGYSGM